MKQDPLLKHLRRRPENFKEDFLQLPPRMQDTLLKVLRANGVPSFDIEKLKVPNYKQNPLLRLLQPTNQVISIFYKLCLETNQDVIKRILEDKDSRHQTYDKTHCCSS